MRNAIPCLALLAVLSPVSAIAQETAQTALPEAGQQVSLTLMAGPVGGAEAFEVCAIDADALKAGGWPACPDSVGVRPVEVPVPEGTVTLLTLMKPADALGHYKAQCPKAEDLTSEMLEQLKGVLLGLEQQKGNEPTDEDIAKLMDGVDAAFLGNPETGSMLQIFGTTEGEYTVIVATAPMGAMPPEPPAADVVDPTQGPVPFDESDPFVRMETTKGTMYIELYQSLAPVTVANFLKLVDMHYYDNLTFHRVLDGFMIQGGDDGKGGPGWMINLEISAIKHSRGTLSMARTDDPNSADAQFFIVHDTEGARHLDGQYAAFGRVVWGIEAVDAIVTAAEGRELPPKDQCQRITKVERVTWAQAQEAMGGAAAPQ